MTPIRESRELDWEGKHMIELKPKWKKTSRKRRSLIISELCKLSRNGWKDAKPYDYEPLEKELKEGGRFEE